MIEGTQAVVRQCLNGLVDNARLLGAGVADLQPTWRTVKTPKTEGIESEKSVLSPLVSEEDVSVFPHIYLHCEGSTTVAFGAL